MDFLKPYTEIIPGVWDVPNDDYHHKLPGLSSTDIRNIHVSIDTYQLRKASPPKPSDSMLEGSALHDLMLLPKEFDDRWFISIYKTKSSKGFKEDVENNPDKDVLTCNQGYSLHMQRNSLIRNRTIKEILHGDTNLREVSIWSDTQPILKIRPDLINDGVMYDLKTTSGSVTPRGFLKSVFQFKYHVQAAYYLYVASLVGLTISDFVFICVERHPPYHTALYTLNEDLLEEGRGFIAESLDRWKAYEAGDPWTGLKRGREVVEL